MNCSCSTVKYQREKRNIPIKFPCQIKNINWNEVPLGEFSDGTIAKQLNVSRNSVRSARRTRNIPAFDESSL